MRGCEIIWDVEKVGFAHQIIKMLLGTVCVDGCNPQCPFLFFQVEVKAPIFEELVSL
jgi:hypothetical protein